MAVKPPYVQSTVAPGAISGQPLPKAPAGGFQQGGWYGGRQYWDGTFSEPGVINKLSNQQGAGQAVSAEVNAQTSAAAGLDQGANQTYINSLYGGTANGGNPAAGTPGTTAPTTPETSALEKEVSDAQARITAKKAEADKRRNEINANPFLSEANRMGGVAKIDSMLNDSLATDQEALKFAQERLTAKQEASKNQYQIETAYDDAGNLTVVTIDKTTGKIVNTAGGGKVGKVTKGDTTTPTEAKAATIKDLNAGLSATTNSYGNVPPEVWNEAMRIYTSEVGTLAEFLKSYGSLVDMNRTDFGSPSGYQVSEEVLSQYVGK